MARYIEDDIADAILVVTDEGLTLGQAALRFDIPKTTLSSRMRGRGAQADQIQPKQRITNNEEVRIKEWALRQESLGYRLSHSQIWAAVEALLKQRGDTTPLGVNWVSGFASKHIEIKIKRGKVQETARFNGFTPKAVNWYFDILEDYGWIKPENIVNVDKGGIMAGYREFLELVKSMNLPIYGYRSR
jgi:hypothetical protein